MFMVLQIPADCDGNAFKDEAAVRRLTSKLLGKAEAVFRVIDVAEGEVVLPGHLYMSASHVLVPGWHVCIEIYIDR